MQKWWVPVWKKQFLLCLAPFVSCAQKQRRKWTIPRLFWKENCHTYNTTQSGFVCKAACHNFPVSLLVDFLPWGGSFQGSIVKGTITCLWMCQICECKRKQITGWNERNCYHRKLIWNQDVMLMNKSSQLPWTTFNIILLFLFLIPFLRFKSWDTKGNLGWELWALFVEHTCGYNFRSFSNHSPQAESDCGNILYLITDNRNA